MINPVEKIYRNLNRKGWRKIWRRIDQFGEKRRYRRWIRQVEQKSATERQNLFEQNRSLPHKPLISVVLPVYNVAEKWLRQCIESVKNQTYENWELCIADDCSPDAHIKKVLREYTAADERIKVVFRPQNGHISAASNSALELATGEFCVLLDHDDELAADALFYVIREINRFPETQMIYSDEDMIDERGRRYEPKFKPDWSLDLFYSLNLVTHLAAYRTARLRKIGGWRVGCEGSQDYDLTLRFIEQIPEDHILHIRHIPHILYHWRAISGSVALSGDEKPYAHERAREAIRAHLKRTGKKARVSATTFNLHRVRYDLPANPPKVSLIMLEKENFSTTAQAIKSIGEATEYQNYEFVLVCSPKSKIMFDAEFGGRNFNAVAFEKESTAESYNFAVSQSDGELLCFIDGNLRPSDKEWLTELVGFAAQTEIGAAGAKIISADGTIQQGGIILGIDDLLGFAHRGLPSDFAGNFGRAQVVNNFSAAAIECLATRREAFQKVGGFAAKNLPENLFDVDFCLRLRRENLRIVWTPYAELVQVEQRKPLNSTEIPTKSETEFFRKKWRDQIARDPFYNPNFSRRKQPFTLEMRKKNDDES